MSSCGGNAPTAAKSGGGTCADDKKTTETSVPAVLAVAPEKPYEQVSGGANGGCKCGPNCNCNPCTCNSK